MTGREAFKLWAPAGARWVDWVRPVSFVTNDGSHGPNSAADFTVPSILYVAKPQENAALIIDMPGYDSVKEGIALARLGFRPVPLYNGTTAQDGAMALIDTHAIESTLRWGALELEKISLVKNAQPAFLLDSSRMHRYKMSISVFDNSWDIYDQDMPPAEYFLAHGITRIIVRADTIQRDLSRILYKFQKKGITILFTNGYDKPKVVTIKKPPRKRS